MKIRRSFVIWCSSILLTVAVVCSHVTAKDKDKKYVCSEANPAALCDASTTCGSASDPCTVDVKRTPNAAAVTPDIPDAKQNKPFCIRVGTTVTWKSKSKNTGFVLDFGPSSPFDQTAIVGGTDRSVSTVARRAGCFKFSAGACTPGSIYGMCSETSAEIIVSGN